MDAATAVTATFNLLPTFDLTVDKDGTGTGTVTSNPAGIDCGATCTAPFASGSVVTLTADARRRLGVRRLGRRLHRHRRLHGDDEPGRAT